MPLVEAGVLDRLIEAYEPDEGRTIVVPTHRGRRGNPILWDRRFFHEIMMLEGDAGARIEARDIKGAAVEEDTRRDEDAALRLDVDVELPEGAVLEHDVRAGLEGAGQVYRAAPAVGAVGGVVGDVEPGHVDGVGELRIAVQREGLQVAERVHRDGDGEID